MQTPTSAHTTLQQLTQKIDKLSTKLIINCEKEIELNELKIDNCKLTLDLNECKNMMKVLKGNNNQLKEDNRKMGDKLSYTDLMYKKSVKDCDRFKEQADMFLNKDANKDADDDGDLDKSVSEISIPKKDKNSHKGIKITFESRFRRNEDKNKRVKMGT